MTISTYYLSCEYDLPKKSDREAFLNIVELTLNRSRFQIALDDKIQLFENNPKGCLETCENFIVEYFHGKPEFVAAWRNYGKNVIVTMPAIWEMSSDVSNAKISFYLEPLLIYGWIKQMYDNLPAIVEAEVDVVIKSTEGKMNTVLNKIKDYVFLEDVWKAPINGKTVMNFFFVILGLVDGALKPEHKDELPKKVLTFLTEGKGSKNRPLFEVSFSKFIGLFATHNYFENNKPAVLSKLFFEDSKKYNTDILKGMEHSPAEL